MERTTDAIPTETVDLGQASKVTQGQGALDYDEPSGQPGFGILDE
jgi:hypothetical protein